ncbi:MAG: CBS domain-containing protein [Rhodospirillales bacterium]
MHRKIVPDVISDQDVAAVTVGTTALEAAEKMAAANIAAVVVNDDAGKLIGIVTERDLTRDVVAKGQVPSQVRVGDIMTKNPDTLAPDDSAMDALQLMHNRKYRHLPVAVDGKCIGMVSVRDLYESVMDALQEDIRETEAFVFGDRYGA